jgi:putative resolvase
VGARGGYPCADRWYRKGRLPVPAQKVGRAILVSPQTAAGVAGKAGGAGLHARVSSDDQQSGLDGQAAQLSAWAADAGLPAAWAEAGVGSGVNGLRAWALGCGQQDIGPRAVELRTSGGAV